MADPQTLARMLMPPPNPAAAPQWAQEAAYNTFVQPIADAYKAQSPQDLLVPVMGAMAPPMAKAGMLAKGLGAEGNALTKGIRAYHGSPYDFDRFDLSKIGTGEGAQAYGHGLYFAGNEKVAKQYRDDLTGMRVSAATRALGNAGGDVDAAIVSVRNEIDRLKNLPNAGNDPVTRDRFIAINEEKLAELNALKSTGSMSKGKMYEVNLNVSPDQLLDWDKPLREQPASLQELVAQGPARWSGNDVVRGQLTAPKGEAIYQRMRTEGNPSDILKDAGIPGIQYLDQGSRNIPADAFASVNMFKKALEKHPNDPMLLRNLEEAQAKVAEYEKQQTRNYVMFDPELIKIVRKYGLAGLTAGPALGAALSQQDGQGGH